MEVTGGDSSSEAGGAWTNEKHVRYLASMEATFVRTMLESSNKNKNSSSTGPLVPPPRLDRHLPDSSDSTLDLKFSKFVKRKKHLISPDINLGPASRILMADRRTRRSASHQTRHEKFQDQVVPQLEKRSDDKGGRDYSNE